MTVKELIARLKKLDGGLRVMVDGYEGGLADVTPKKIYIISAHTDVNDEDYYGPHQEHQKKSHCSYCPTEGVYDHTVKAVVLGR